MGRPNFDDSIIGGDGSDDIDGGIVGYVQESGNDTGVLQASGAPEDLVTGAHDPDDHETK